MSDFAPEGGDQPGVIGREVSERTGHSAGILTKVHATGWEVRVQRVEGDSQMAMANPQGWNRQVTRRRRKGGDGNA